MLHWTYAPWDPESDLEQGDLLLPTQELRDVLAQVHRHFCDEKYLGFCVASQSCDLVRRGETPIRARYVSIATVRSLRQVLPRLLATMSPPVAPGVFRASFKLEAKKFLARLFDQNEQALGLFYLHPDTGVGLGEAAVVFLRVKVALRSEHYPVLVRARKARLDPEFRAKFGWLVGNLYSRADAPDWSDFDGGRKAISNMTEEYLAERIEGLGPAWVEDELVEAGLSANVQFQDRDRTELLDELERHRPKPRLEQLIDVVSAEVGKVIETDEERLKKLANRLRNSGHLKKLLK